MKRVATHKQPDPDAVASAWLAETYLFAGEEVEIIFVPRQRPRQAAPAADCFVDVANTHDPEQFCFEHKPPAVADRNATCATKLVWEHLLRLDRPVGHPAAAAFTHMSRRRGGRARTICSFIPPCAVGSTNTTP